MNDSRLIRQFPEEQRKLVRRIFKREGGDLSRDQFFRREKAQSAKDIDRDSGLTGYERLIRNLIANYGCTEEEAGAMTTANLYDRELLR